MIKRDKSIETKSEEIDPAINYLKQRLQLIQDELKNIATEKDNEINLLRKKTLEKNKNTIEDILKNGNGINEYLKTRISEIDDEIKNKESIVKGLKYY